MRKYEKLSEEIIANVGGKENIGGLTHCVTRLRFQLKDESKANDEVIKNMEGVVTLMKSAGQYQVVIGNHVPDVYDEVCLQTGIDSGSTASDTKKMSVGAYLIDFVSGLMGPILAVLTASGMIKGVLAIAVFANWIDNTSGLYAVLNGVGDAIFCFFPVALGYSSANKLKIDPFVGLTIGAALMYPSLQNVDLDVVGLAINVSYQSTVLPVILTTIFASFIYKPLMKIIPDVVKTFVVPMITLLIAIPLGFIAIGPVANTISTWIADIVMGIYSFSPVLAGVVMGAGWQILVIFGVHMGLVAVALVQLYGNGQPTPIFALSNAASYAQTAVVFAIWLKTKDKKLKSIALPAWISGIFGVTEPAIYGVTLPRMKYFIISCIGSAIGGAYAGFSGLLVYQMAGMGIFAIPGFLGGEMAVGMIMFHLIVSIAAATIFSFVVTMILYKDDKDVEETKNSVSMKTMSETISAPIKGEVLPLSESKDQAFALGALGQGVVIVPSEGKVYAPATGTVTTLFPSLHAVGITTDDGVQILIHVGLDTVQLQGEGFTAHIAQGDKVSKGQLLLDFDIPFIKEKGYEIETPIIITNSKDLLDIVETKNKTVSRNDELFTVLF